MSTNGTIAYKKWRLKLILKWIGACGVAGTIIPLAIFVGGFWEHLAEIALPLAFGIMIGLDIKNGNSIRKALKE